MKFVCIYNINSVGSEHPLTIGKVYESIKSDRQIMGYDMINIVNDIGERYWYFIELFDTLDNARNKKLTTIGI